eukprot:1310511-Pyramimonas_sp.AAC.1
MMTIGGNVAQVSAKEAFRLVVRDEWADIDPDEWSEIMAKRLRTAIHHVSHAMSQKHPPRWARNHFET